MTRDARVDAVHKWFTERPPLHSDHPSGGMLTDPDARELLAALDALGTAEQDVWNATYSAFFARNWRFSIDADETHLLALNPERAEKQKDNPWLPEGPRALALAEYEARLAVSAARVADAAVRELGARRGG